MKTVLRSLMAVAVLSLASSASADDDLRLFLDPTSFTDVADAVDGDDPFDLNVHVAFRRTMSRATLSREPGSAADGRASQNQVAIGEWAHDRNELELGLDIGLFHDVMLFVRLPLVLSDSRSITLAEGADPAAVQTLLTPAEPVATPTPLFSLPFESPTRSGIDRVIGGLAFSLMNQARRPYLPTWTMLLQGRFGIGSLMQPCQDGTDCDPGVSDGTHAVRFETRLSRRYRVAELFGGIGYEFAWAGRAEDQFSPSGRLSGYQNRRPPMRGFFTAGAAFVPWENKATWQRFSVDLQLRATYVSEGRDYSPLYDALGTSQSPYLTTPNLEGLPNGSSALREVPFNGLTDVQDHGEYGGSFALEMQAARYVRLKLGVDLDFVTAHQLTISDACNPGASPSGADDPRAGACTEGIINPHYRTVIDLPGNRFQQDAGLRTRFYVEATAQF